MTGSRSNHHVSDLAAHALFMFQPEHALQGPSGQRPGQYECRPGSRRGKMGAPWAVMGLQTAGIRLMPDPEDADHAYCEGHFGCARCLVWAIVFEAGLVFAMDFADSSAPLPVNTVVSRFESVPDTWRGTRSQPS
jgi:hypothetical protein